jgi:serine/threonine-protein kinase
LAAGAETQQFFPPASNDPTPTAVVAPVSHRDEQPPPRRTWLWVLLLLLLAAAVIAALIAIPKLTSDGGPSTVQVPRIIGMTVDEAQAALRQQGLSLGAQTTVTTPAKDRNHIIHQDPAPNDNVDEGTEIAYTLVVPPKKVDVPFVTDSTLDEAIAMLEARNLKADPQPDNESTERKNQVTSTDPSPGTPVRVGSTVTVFYSTGFVEVPNVIGSEESAAKQELNNAGFKPVVSNVVSDTPAGTVTDQSPGAFTRQPFGSTVVISVSLGPTTPTEPTGPTGPTGPTDTFTTAPTTTAPTARAPSGVPTD